MRSVAIYTGRPPYIASDTPHDARCRYVDGRWFCVMQCKWAQHQLDQVAYDRERWTKKER